MASVDSSTNNPNDPNNPNNVPGAISQPGQTNQPATTGGAGGVTATGSGNVTGQVVGTNNPSQPFQNISSYLAANAPQSQQLAGQVAGTVSAPITEAQSGITNAANQFTESVNKGYTPDNKDLTSAVSTNPAYVVAENPENVTNFQALLNNKYTGPTDFTQTPGYSDLEAKIAAAQGKAANTQTPQGVQSLLGAVEGPTTAGINKLDSLLLYQNPDNLKTIQDAGAPAANLLPSLQSTTTAQNELAGQGATNASSSAAAAAKALQDALSGEKTNLGGQQNTIQGIIDEYNKSVGIINPVTQTIASDIQNFLAANPNLKLSDATSALAPLMNLASISMPQESTYASPYDYQTIQALAKLGLSSEDLAGLPITGDQSNLAQTFKIPDQLQNAVGQAPGVEKALNDELSALSGQITGAVSPFQDVQSKREADWSFYAQYPAQFQAAQQAVQAANVDLNTVQRARNPNLSDIQKATDALNAAKKNLSDLQAKKVQIDQEGDALGGQAAQLAQGLQWVNTAAPGYNELISQINAELGKLGNVGVPSLTYQPTTLTDPVVGAPIGAVGKDIGNAAAIGTGVGATAAGAIPSLAAPAIADSVTAMAGPGALDALGLSPAQAAGPAAIAAYGASNIARNSIANPISSGLSTLANTGLSLATLSLPPQIFESIGKDIKNVINSIGDFFGSLF